MIYNRYTQRLRTGVLYKNVSNVYSHKRSTGAHLYYRVTRHERKRQIDDLIAAHSHQITTK